MLSPKHVSGEDVDGKELLIKVMKGVRSSEVIVGIDQDTMEVYLLSVVNTNYVGNLQREILSSKEKHML